MIGGFETELLGEFFRGVANHAGLTLHLRLLVPGQRPPHDRGLLQGVRARAGAGAVALDPRVTGVPSTKGSL